MKDEMAYSKRSLGQNFLVDPNYRRKIVSAVSSLYHGGTVLEIGPGRGALSQGLAEFAERLVLVEKDRWLAGALRDRWRDHPSVIVVESDFLTWDVESVGIGPFTVVSNLPYNVASQILIKLLRNMRRFRALVLMFQKEVALRCVAHPATENYGVLSVWCRSFALPEKLFDVPPSAFNPRPKITSSVVRFLPGARGYDARAQAFIDFVRLLFSERRKKIGSVLKRKMPKPDFARVFALHKDLLERRVETLGIAELALLHQGCGEGTIPNTPSNLP